MDDIEPKFSPRWVLVKPEDIREGDRIRVSSPESTFEGPSSSSGHNVVNLIGPDGDHYAIDGSITAVMRYVSAEEARIASLLEDLTEPEREALERLIERSQ